MNIDGWSDTICRVYGTGGVSPTVPAHVGDIKILESDNPTKGGGKIEYAGRLDRKFVSERDVMSVNGISKTITANHHGSLSAPKIMVESGDDE